ncbi:MAG: hypothetical protein K0S06_2571 [Microvirga sp.]|jgi:hypothetical protein|nr:hypothetical protein [Microvirga sp.]
MADLANSGKPWTDKEERRLAWLLSEGASVTTLSAEFKRTEAAIRDKRQEMTRRARGQVSRYAVRRDSPLAA